MDYKPRPILSNPTLNKTYKKKRIFWFNSDFNDGFTSNNNKITDISFNVPPFQIYNNNNMRVITYIRNDANVSPIIIKLKEPYCDNRLITNTDKEGNAIIYINHTGVEGMTSMSPNFLLIPQQIPRFVFRLDDNFNQLNADYYFSSVTNGSFFQVAGGSPDDKYLLFNSSGSFTLNANLNIDVLVVGGGGGGASRDGGGGGAGALIYKTNYSLSAGTYSIVIGAGGAGATGFFPGGGYPSNYGGQTGSDTTITNSTTSTIIFRAKGGGGGAFPNIGTGGIGGCNGGNTAGTTAAQPSVSNQNIPQDSDVFGNKGGVSSTSSPNPWATPGGGGVGGVGGSQTMNGTTITKAGNGGIGLQIAITGTNIYYGGGGGGGCFGDDNIKIPPGDGGLGGGGAGSRTGKGTKATNGTPNTGGGGGGGGFGPLPRDGSGYDDNSQGGDGGSGVVIIKFRETRQEGITPVNNKPPSFMLGLELEDIDMKKDNIVSIYR